MGHHGGHGTTAAAMVHHVLSIYMSFVRELYVKYTFPPNEIFVAGCSARSDACRLVDGGRCLGNQIVGYCPSNNSRTCRHYGLSCYCTPWQSAKGCFIDHRDVLKQYRCRDTLMLLAQAIIDGGMGIAIT